MSIRYQSVSGIGENRTVDLIVTEKLVHEFYLRDSTNENWQLSQMINLMNVNYTSKMDVFLGAYGPFEQGNTFTPIVDHRIS